MSCCGFNPGGGGGGTTLAPGTFGGQTLVWDGAAWVPNATGTVTNLVLLADDEVFLGPASAGATADAIIADFANHRLFFGENYGVDALHFDAGVNTVVSFTHNGWSFLTSDIDNFTEIDSDITLGDGVNYREIHVLGIIEVELGTPHVRLSDNALVSQNGLTLFQLSNAGGLQNNLGIFGDPAAGYGTANGVAYFEDAADTGVPGAPADGSFLYSRGQALESFHFSARSSLRIGTTPPSTGSMRISHGSTWVGLNSTGLTDIQIIDWGATSANQLTIGGNTVTNTQFRAASTLQFNIVNTTRMQITNTQAIMSFGAGQRFVVTGTGIGFNGVAAVAPPTYTISGDSTDRSFNAGTALLNEIANVLATLIRDLGSTSGNGLLTI